MTIAGSDPSGGAGIQADLKTFAALGVHGYSVLTAVIAQNSAKVLRVAPVEAGLITAQIAALVAERRPDALKTGALGGVAVVRAVARAIPAFNLPRPVVDPVLVSSSGRRLLDRAGEQTLIERLLPLARVVTPNIAEAERLSGVEIHGVAAMRAAAKRIRDIGAQAVVIKGGHLSSPALATDLLFDGRDYIEFKSPRLPGGGAHGTGCVFSAAIAAYLAKGMGLEDAVREAKRLISRALRRRYRLGRGRPVLDPFTGH